MSCRTFARPAPLLLKNPEILMAWFIQYPAPSSKFQVRQTNGHRYCGQPAKMFPVVILDKDVPVLCGNGFRLFAGKGAVRQPEVF